MLERMYSTFPGGWPGLGLLLLRVTVGVILVTQGICHLELWHGLSALLRVIASLEIVGGLALCAGYLTPFAAVLVGVLRVVGAFAWLQVPDPDFFAAPATTVMFFAIVGALFLLGPGAFSADARLFGRREIIIQSSPR